MVRYSIVAFTNAWRDVSHQSVPPEERRVTRRMSGDERRDSILESATAEFARTGYQGATISRIATEAGCSEPNLYKHFSDKRTLLFDCLRRTEQRAEAELESIVGAPDRFARLTAIIDTSIDYRRMLQLRMLCCTLPEDAELIEHLRGGTDRLVQRFSAGIELGKAEGTVRPDVDATHVAWTWLGLSLAACNGAVLDGEDRFHEVMDVGKRMLIATLMVTPNGV